MTPTRALWLAFALALGAAIVLQWPLRSLLSATGIERSGFSAGLVRGSLWSGRIDRTQWRGMELGHLHASLAPLPLLLGRTDLALRGESARGVLLGGRHQGVRDLQDSWQLPPLHALAGLRPTLRAESVHVEFARGRCIVAEGNLRVDWADPPAAGLLPAMQGSPTCEGGRMRLRLVANGTEPAAVPTLQLELAADGSYRASLVLPDNRHSAAWLAGAGIRPVAQGLSREWNGNLTAAHPIDAKP